MKQKIYLLIGLLLFSSCGFHVIYKSDNKISDKSQAYNEELASIQIEVSRKKINQDLKNNLEKVLNPDDIKVDPKYSIIITLDKTLVSTFTTSTGSSGRNKVILTANYRLKDLNSGEVIATGTTTAKDNFDVENDKRFANYIAEDSISSNLTLIIAQNIRNLLINDIVNTYKIRDIPNQSTQDANFGVVKDE
ncbi:MAG: hypothetical protein V4612_01370 [Pseudomonadota bacterium]